MRNLILFLFISLIACSCGSTIEETIEEKYPDGKPKVVRFYEKSNDSKELLKEIVYYPNGFIRVEGEYKNSIKHGKWVYWFENGNKWSEGNFIEGRRDGIHKTYYENGSKYTEGKWEMGKRSGIWKFWNPQGGLDKEIDYDK